MGWGDETERDTLIQDRKRVAEFINSYVKKYGYDIVLKKGELDKLLSDNGVVINDTFYSHSDICYDSANEGTIKNFHNLTHLFTRPKRGYYRLLGENYPYNGEIIHSGNKSVIGKWVDGTITEWQCSEVVEPISKLIFEKYELVDTIDNKKNIQLVKDLETGILYVKKSYTTYNEEVFERLKSVKVLGIPTIKEIKKENGILYTIEEYVPGTDLLKEFENNGVFSEDEIYDIAIKVCDILKELHSQIPPMIHRDIKPSNIIKKEDGAIVLIDFNASKIVSENNNQDTMLFGTQFFGAPEQLLGYGQSDQTTDIFAIGATMTYLATGMYHNQVIAPGKLHSIWEKCVNMDKNSRYQSVVELKDALIKAYN